MSILDGIISVIIGLNLYLGLKNGAIKMISSLITLIVYNTCHCNLCEARRKLGMNTFH